MAQDWASDVKKYAPDADDGVIAGIVRYCGIALQKVDSSLVAFSDPVELARVRNNFLKKKCGLTDSDDVLDAAIAEVGERMKADRTKNRVTVYYLLSDRFGMHSLFVKAAKATAAKAAPVAAAAAGLALVGGAAKASAKAPATRAAKPKAAAAPAAARTAKPKAVAAPVAALAAVGSAPVATAAAAPVSVAAAASVAPAAKVAAVAGGAAALAARTSAGLSMVGHWRDGSSPLGRKLNLFGGKDAGRDMRGLMWLLLALAALAVVWAFMTGKVRTYDVVAPAVAPAVATPVAEAVIPDGAGIVAEVRDEKPVVKVYFATGKADVAPEFAAEAATLKAYLDTHAGSTLGVSGYNDPTGNAAINAALSKKRAEAVKAALVAATIPDTAIELIKPEAATDATVTAAEARRVEVYIK